ncbi:MAG: trigger factor [Paludibacteraceae bacterium]|nr:trigger factor [Paludibacteraceae bacterium]
MQVNRTDIDALNARLTVVVEPQDYEEKVQKQLKDIRRRANIPGFRPGMVPAGLVKKMYGKAVLGEEVNKAINDGIFNYIKEQNLNILAEPLPNDEETPAIDWDVDTTFTFAFDIALAPEFDAKLNGKNKLTYYDIQVTDTEVQNQVDAYAQRFGDYVQVDEYQAGDMLKGKMTELKEGGKVKDNAVLSPDYMQNDDQKHLFEGAKKGDVITFNPKQAYNNEVEISSMLDIKKEEVADLADQFTFEIESITRHQKAEVNEALFAKVFGEGNIADEAAFREHISNDIKRNFTQDADYKFGLDAKAAILKKMDKLQFPEDFLKRWLLQTNEQKMTAEEIDKQFPQMIEELKWHLAKDQLAKAFDIKVETEEVQAYAKEMTRMQFLQYGLANVDDAMLTQYAQETLKNEDQVRGIVDRVQENKIYEALKGVVKLETKEITYDDFGKLFEK